MAPRNATAPATDEGTATEAGTNGADGSANSRPGRIYVVVPMTKEMKDELVKQADAKDSPVGIVARDMLANLLNMTVPVVTASRPRKYANAEEAKVAQKKALKERNSLVKALLAKFKEGALPAELAAAVEAQAAEIAAAQPETPAPVAGGVSEGQPADAPQNANSDGTPA